MLADKGQLNMNFEIFVNYLGVNCLAKNSGMIRQRRYLIIMIHSQIMCFFFLLLNGALSLA